MEGRALVDILTMQALLSIRADILSTFHRRLCILSDGNADADIRNDYVYVRTTPQHQAPRVRQQTCMTKPLSTSQ